MENDEVRIGGSTVIMNSELERRRKKAVVECPVLLFWWFSRGTWENKEALIRIVGVETEN
jgi:hypothetical protein